MPMTNQEIFDTVAKHLFAQGKPALDDYGACVYRGENGMRCAVGCLITDEEYSLDMEYKSAKTVVRDWGIEAIHPGSFDLAESLQKVHDYEKDDDGYTPWNDTGTMRNALRNVAVEYGLNYSILDTLSFSGR